jgi:DNA repair protein RecO (recombination protein O)
MEFSAPGIVLSVAPYGEGDAVVAVFTEAEGVYRGLARGAMSRGQASIWQAGNLVQAKWMARLADQLGSYSAELIHASAALAMQDAWALGILSAVCAVTEGAVPEREAQARIFRGVLHLVAHAGQGVALLDDLIRWELGLLQALGYGLDLAACAVTGAREGLAYVSPRTGRAVSDAGAGLWKERLLVLPGFLVDAAAGDMTQYADGLRLTGHFLARDVFGLRHRPVPNARILLEEKVCKQAGLGSGEPAAERRAPPDCGEDDVRKASPRANPLP